jgi:uncharacterized protein (TIGR03437 family)
VALLSSSLPVPKDESSGNREIVFADGRIYTTDGFVIDAEAMRIVTRVNARGPVAVDGNRVYWLDSSNASGQRPLLIQAFDLATLVLVETRPINVTSADGSSLISCGEGRLAFRAGNEIYIVDPISTSVATVEGVVNAASFVAGAPIASGSIAAAFGVNMALAPTDEISVRLNGFTAPIYASTPTQINFQVPWELAGQSQASLVVTARGISGNAFTVALAPLAPGIFTTTSSGSGQGAILVAGTGSFAGSRTMFSEATPVQPGSFISIYATGLGALTNQPQTGVAAVGSPASQTTTIATVTVGGVAAPVSYSGLAPGFFGLYQVNARVPINTTPGDAVPVTVTIGTATSNTVTIAVQ